MISEINLPKFLTTVTPFSKILALVLFITMPFLGFYLGLKYQTPVINVCQPLLNDTSEAQKPASIPTANIETVGNLKPEHLYKETNINLVPSP